MRIGMGYDVHKLVEGRKLILGGVEIPYEKGLLGHSDADVLLLSLIHICKKSISGGDAALSFRTLGDKGELEKDSGKRISDRSWDRHSRSRVSGRSADCRF